MDTRADFQRLLEDMDKAIANKRQELSELDERLESARGRLSEQEAQELLADQSSHAMMDNQHQVSGDNGKPVTRRGRPHMIGLSNRPPLVDDYLQEQSKLYEQQLERFGEELSEFESINQELVGQNEKLGGQLAGCLDELEKSKARSELMKENLQELQSANLELNLRLAKAESELLRNQKLLKQTNKQDEVLMYALNDKLETLKRAIELRDEEIKRLKSTMDNHQFNFESFDVEQIKGLLVLLSEQDIAGDSQSEMINLDKRKQVIEIARAFKERDQEIVLLKGQLLQASKDLEHNASLLELMKGQHQPDQLHLTGGEPSSRERERYYELEELTNKYQIAENELEVKDRQLHLAEFRIHHYETILPNMISDLVRELATTSAQLISYGLIKSNKEEENSIRSLMDELVASLSRLPGELSAARALLNNIDQLREANEAKEAHIEQLVDELNRLDVKFNLVQQQCDLLQQQQEKGRTNDLPISIGSSEEPTSRLESAQERLGDPLNSSQNVNAREDPRAAAGSHSPECQVPSVSDESLRATSSNGQSQLGRGLLSISGAPPPPPPKLARAATTTARVAQQNEGHQSVNASGKRSISVSGQQVAFAGRATLEQQSPPDGSSKETAQVTHNSNSSTDAGSNTSNDAVGSRNSQMLTERNNGRTKQVAIKTDDDSRQKRLRQLESENELLELAMKEILLSIKWSDAQCSTILIDCPSLERLCQLIEARFLAKALVGGAPKGAVDHQATSSDGPITTTNNNNHHLFQLIVLKSELDLLRGQNEQLRADVKIHRREYQEVLMLSARPNDLQPEQLGSARDEPDSPATVREPDGRKEVAARQATVRGADGSAEGVVAVDSGPTGKLDASVDNGNDKTASGDKCPNCSRLTGLINHLFQCIVRLENRVNMSEETYIARLLSLRHLIQILERDLTVRESLLNKSQRECQSMAQQKLSSETRLQFVETELGFHLRICPMISSTGAKSFNPFIISNRHDKEQRTSTPAAQVINAGNRLQVYTTTTAQSRLGDESIQSLTSISSNNGHHQQVEQLPTMRSARLTISLLQSIIGCLQARLDYKDERLRNLESLLTSRAGANRLASTDSDLSPSSDSNQQEIIRV